MKNKFFKTIIFILKIVVERYTNYNFKRNAYYINYVRKKSIENKSILFESYHGVNFTGNVYAIFLNIINNYPEYKCYIAINNINNPMIKWIKKNYKHKNIEIIEYQSKNYIKILATAKYLVNDTSFFPYFNKRQEQIYLNTWHGTPLKKLGKDINSAGFNENKNIQKNLLTVDKLIAPNKFTAEKLIESNDLMGVFNAEIKISGNARMDLTLNKNVNYIYSKYNMSNDKSIILYAPTYRKTIDEIKNTDINELIEETKLIQKQLGDDYRVYLKTHYFTAGKLKNSSDFDFIIPNWVDSNELLSIVDILITDYSSIFFDFLPLKKPIYFYMKDKSDYDLERGLYFNFDELPGKVSQDINELIKDLSIPQYEYLKSYKEIMEEFINTYCLNDKGDSAVKAANFLLGKVSGEYLFKSDKKPVVFYGGGFYNNGITSSIINLSKNFNYEKYELIIIENDNLFDEKITNIKRLDSRVHFITQFTDINKNLMDDLMLNLFYRKGYNSYLINKKRIKKLFREYSNQIFGNLKPEALVDYGGYNKIFSSIFAFAPVKKRAIYLHNDMYEEFHKKINGRYKHRWNLKIIFSLYNQFSKIISVSESTKNANIINLRKLVYISPSKMISISNVVDGDHIIEMAKFKEIGNKIINIEINGVKRKYVGNITNNSANYRGVILPDKKDVNFINVARLSPEKNHINLIKAFKEIVFEKNNCKLFILGDGPLYESLKNQIKYLELENHVFMLGYISNPYMFIEKSDCFILTSNYEGQGLSILEAQILNKPVIGTNVNGIKSIINKNSGILVDNNIQSIIKGIKDFIDGNVSSSSFDYKKYNQKIIKKIEKEIL